MHGTDRQIIVKSKIYWINIIVLALTTNRVYFANSKLDFIVFVNYDGTGRTQVLSSSKFVQHPHALAIFEDMMYYSDRRLQKLQVYPKYPNETTGESFIDGSGKKCVDDAKPFLVIIQKTNLFGIEMNFGSPTETPVLAGMVPLSGLGNAFFAAYDAFSKEIFILEHTNRAKTLAQITTDSAIYRSTVNGGNKTKMFSSAVPDNVYCLGFD